MVILLYVCVLKGITDFWQIDSSLVRIGQATDLITARATKDRLFKKCKKPKQLYQDEKHPYHLTRPS